MGLINYLSGSMMRRVKRLNGGGYEKMVFDLMF